MSSASRPLTVITGGGRGIGAATVAHLVRHGHDVVLGYLSDRVAAEEVVAAARALGARALAVRGDVVDEDDVEALFAAAAVLGPVSGLVNNAGVTAHLGELAETPVPVVRRVVEVNLIGALLCARRAAQVMSTSRGGAGGAIVNVSSAAATLGSTHEYVHYAAAKAGVEAMGTHHHVSKEHLDRYLSEFAFRHGTHYRTDSERMRELMTRTGGRRLTYKPLTERG